MNEHQVVTEYGVTDSAGVFFTSSVRQQAERHLAGWEKLMPHMGPYRIVCRTLYVTPWRELEAALTFPEKG